MMPVESKTQVVPSQVAVKIKRIVKQHEEKY